MFPYRHTLKATDVVSLCAIGFPCYTLVNNDSAIGFLL